MKIKRFLGVWMLAAWLAGSIAYAQQPAYEPIFPAPTPIPAPKTAAPVDEKLVPATGGLSDWIQYRRDCCEGPHGRYTPLYTEFYLNSGVTFPVGGMTLSRELKPGWSITGGLRAMFFNEPFTSAWVVDGHIINTDESAGKRNTAFPVTIFQNGTKFEFGTPALPGATLQNSNRTLVGVGLGREWYCWQPANHEGCTWRIGVDAGGRWGSQRVNLNEFGHLTDVIGSLYAAAHTDFEIPLRSCLFHAGVRFEWAYTWSDILQRTSDVQDLSVLLTVGIRY